MQPIERERRAPEASSATGGVSEEELALFTRQLGAMLGAGVDPLRALRIAGRHSGNERLVAVARDLSLALQDGRELHEALARHPELFDAFYLEMTRQGERDGTLGEALLAIADYLDQTSLARARLAPTLAGSAAPREEAADAPTAPATAAVVLAALGAAALGSGILGLLAAPGWLPGAWLAPLAALWSGGCLLVAARRLGSAAPSETAAPAPAPPVSPALPPKSPERRAAETEGVVRLALLEQQEEQEGTADLPPFPPFSAEEAPGRPSPNGGPIDPAGPEGFRPPER